MNNNNFKNILLVLSIINLIYSLLNLNFLYIILAFLLVFIILFFKYNNKMINIINKILIIIFFSFCIINSSKILYKSNDTEYLNKNYNELYMYAKSNNIKVNVNYEYSDKVKENKIIVYNIKDNKHINVVVSKGPNMNKKIIIPYLIGKNNNYVSKFIKTNYLNNVEIVLNKTNICNNNILIDQSTIGTVNRNEKIKFSFCMKKEYKKIHDFSLVNKNKYEAIIYLLSNNYKYEEIYEFSNIIEKNNIIKSKEIEKEKKIVLYISKGKEIIVPNFNKLNTKEINNWIIKNNLNVKFNYVYNNKIKKGKYISANIKSNNKISQIDNIVLYFSLGKLKLPNFSKLNEFKDFAYRYKIKYKI